jgi:hypothetical protein
MTIHTELEQACQALARAQRIIGRTRDDAKRDGPATAARYRVLGEIQREISKAERLLGCPRRPRRSARRR